MKINKKKTDKVFNSLDEVEKNGWLVKLSIMGDKYILAIIRSKITNQTIIRYFDEEDIALSFIDFVSELNADEEQDI
jgi:hypothetical protein